MLDHKNNISKSDRSLEQIKAPSPAKKVLMPPSAKASPSISGGCKSSTFISRCSTECVFFSERYREPILRLVWMYVPPYHHVYASVVKSSNLSVSRSSSSGSQRANTSAKQSPASAEGWGSLGWLSSLLATPVQAAKKPMPNLSKGMSTHHPPPGYCLARIECCFAS